MDEKCTGRIHKANYTFKALNMNENYGEGRTIRAFLIC